MVANRSLKFPLHTFICLLALLSIPLYGQVKLPRLISDGMVLQRDTELKIWGEAAPNEKIELTFIDQSYTTTAGSEGHWEVTLKPLKSGGPFTMTISGSNTIELQEILIGDVWLCSGQSNMELPMRRVAPLYPDEIKNARNNFIRYFQVPKTYNFKEEKADLSAGSWKRVTPENISEFSAVAYFFAKNINQKYGVPIGLIDAALGGSPAEAWLSKEALKKFPEHYNEAEKYKDDSLIYKTEQADNERANAWYSKLAQKDLGNKDMKWSDPDLETDDWKNMSIPGYWDTGGPGKLNGTVWFRKEVDISKEHSGKAAKLEVGRIVDADSVWVNGVFVGRTTYQYPPRWYTIPVGVLQGGKNTIAIKVISLAGTGGFVPDKPYELRIGDEFIDLKGQWKYKTGAEMPPLQGPTFIRWKPNGLYNAMIAPLLNFEIKGVLWYQGESNVSGPKEYSKLFPAVIEDWRNKWDEQFPFLFVQLANFMESDSIPSESSWALLREAQRQTLQLPNTGMAVAIDVGEWNDIHPLNKKAIGERLALAAQKIAYNDDVVYSGPVYKKMSISGDSVVLEFQNTGSGLIAKGDTLAHFAIAGADGKFHWANAKIEGNKVVVWSQAVEKPVSVRYGWADNPEGANLYNKEGLPASPFTTEEGLFEE